MQKKDHAAATDISLVDNYAASIDDVAPRQLTEDARLIFAAIEGQTYAGHNTLLCVALRDKNQHVKKFMFANTGVPARKLRQVAGDLYYYHSCRTDASHVLTSYEKKRKNKNLVSQK